MEITCPPMVIASPATSQRSLLDRDRQQRQIAPRSASQGVYQHNIKPTLFPIAPDNVLPRHECQNVAYGSARLPAEAPKPTAHIGSSVGTFNLDRAAVGLLNHLVRANQHRLGDSYSEGFCSC